MDLTIMRKNGRNYKLSDLGIKTLDFVVDAPKPRHNFPIIDNTDGSIDLGTSYEGRTGKAMLYLKAFDAPDWPLLRNELFNLFDSREAFYVVDSREPGKRWLFKTEHYTPEQLTDKRGKVEIPFISSSSYAESIGSTLNDKTFDLALWQTGQGLTLDETMYTHSNGVFRIYNASDGVKIEPRKMPIVIRFKGASANLAIKNNTTNEFWVYNGTTSANDTIELDRVRSLKNGTSIFGQTNRKLITLQPGWNDMEVVGTIGAFTVEFDFRFYTL